MAVRLGSASLAAVFLLAACAPQDTVATVAPADHAVGEGIVFEIHRSESCACCEEYVDYLEERGADVRQVISEDVVGMKHELGIPQELFSCHTSIVQGYAVEGHVPLEVVLDLLAERPPIDAIALAGMPAGSPGMGGERDGPWTIHSVTDGFAEVHTEY
jgi:hypothetical protein